MAFKETVPQFQMINITLIDPDPSHPRQNIDENSLKGLANSIQKKGLIHPIVVQPASPDGRHTIIVGERRWRAAVLAGEKTVPILIRPCEPDEALELRVFENLGLGMRVALEPRDMANAIQTIADRFETREAAAEHFGRNPTWLSLATAAANLSPKVTALLDSGKISSTGAAIQLEKLAQKNEAKAESLIDQIEQLPEGEKLAKKDVDVALSEESGRRRKKENAGSEAPPAPQAVEADDSSPSTGEAATEQSQDAPPWENAPTAPATPAPAPRRPGVNPSKVKKVAELLGLGEGDEEEILVRLIDEFLAMKGETTPPF
ncbi:MAG: ParB-like partition protein [Rhodocyclaceae bacterium]|nr:ParB-like partition protein [Rhodocyclaceae bacterium]